MSGPHTVSFTTGLRVGAELAAGTIDFSPRGITGLPTQAAAAAASMPGRGRGRVPPHAGQVTGGDHRIRRQAVYLGLVEQQEERPAAADAVLRAVQVEPRVRLAGRCSSPTRSWARSRSSSRGPNWMDSVGQAFAQAGVRPSPSRS